MRIGTNFSTSDWTRRDGIFNHSGIPYFKARDVGNGEFVRVAYALELVYLCAFQFHVILLWPNKDYTVYMQSFIITVVMKFML